MSKKRVMALDWFKRVSWISLQDYEKKPTAHSFNGKELRKELHLITSKGKVLKGFYAIRKMMLQCPLLVIPGVICYVPFVDFFGNRLYRWVAKNRYLFFRQSCDDGKCSL
jgi:predicted DCC family thiol-disulfide oxidoreductase YuxK